MVLKWLVQALPDALPRVDVWVRLWVPLALSVVVTTVLAVGWFTQPDHLVRGYSPEQPIAFSHRQHAGLLKIPCQYCHGGVRRARQAGIPAVAVCMRCHRVTRTDRPAIQELARLEATGAPLVWRRVHALPDHVFFDHRPHVAAGLACQTCHGEVQAMDRVEQVMSMRMGHCLGCHRDPAPALPAGSPIPRAPENCNACHR